MAHYSPPPSLWQVLSLSTTYTCASILSTEAQLRKLLPDMRQADTAYTAAAAAAPAPCVVFAGSKADVSRATGFKHSALSILAIVRRPPSAHTPLSEVRPRAQLPCCAFLQAVVRQATVAGRGHHHRKC